MDPIGNEYQGQCGKYKTTKHLASGGMGHVYEAKEIKTGTNVVIKLPATHMPDGKLMPPDYYQKVVDKLKVESNVLKNFAGSRPPNIVGYIDESIDPDNFYLVIEKIFGSTVTKAVPSSGLSENQVIDMSLDVLNGLKFLHHHNTIYRDMKPDNIMITNNGQCIIIDFGGAKQGLTRMNMDTNNVENKTGFVSAGWTCPHQDQGSASAECDLYAFGRIMFYMSTGYKPHRFTSPTGRMKKKIREIRPSINTRLSDLVDSLIDPDHNTNHTATDLMTALNQMRKQVKYGRQYLQKSLSQPLSQKIIPSPVNSTSKEPRIVLQGVEYKISNRSGGSLIGKKHDVISCQISGDGCNRYEHGRNIFVGWVCPNGCRCNYNPSHMMGQHHMRIWNDNTGQVCVINNDSVRRSAIYRYGKWIPMIHNKKEILKNHDQVALLYNEKKGPYITFTFYER